MFWVSISLLFWPGGWVGGGFGGMESKTNSAPNSVRVGKLGLSLAIASNIKMTSKWRQQEKWRWFKIEDDLQKENVILKTIPGPSLYDLSRHCCYQFCSIFMQVYEEFILSIGQCSTNIKFCTQYIFEYICKKITNIEYIRNLTAYRIRISNLFVSSNLA